MSEKKEFKKAHKIITEVADNGYMIRHEESVYCNGKERMVHTELDELMLDVAKRLVPSEDLRKTCFSLAQFFMEKSAHFDQLKLEAEKENQEQSDDDIGFN